MAFLYRGAGPGSYWHINDARINGFTPHFPGATPSHGGIMKHIARASTTSPYISFSRSYAVGRVYGLVGSSGLASKSNPGYVYEIEVQDDSICKPLDPIIEISQHLPKPWLNPHYQHDGAPTFLLGVVDPVNMLDYLSQNCLFPPGTAATPRPPNLSQELETIVRALRDSEILIQGNVPASVVRNRYDVY